MNSPPQGSAEWTQVSVELALALDVWTCRGVEDGPNVLLTAGVHGDEYEGPAAILEIVRRLDPRTVRGSITAIPVVNPMAFAAGTRTSPDDDVNLARVFPGDPKGSVTERLAAAVWDRFVSRTQYLIDLHSGGVEYVFLPVAGFYGEAGDDNPSYQAAIRFGLPAVWRLPSTSGVMSNEAWKRGIVAIGNEYLGSGQLSPEGIRSYIEGVRSCLRFWGVLNDGAPSDATPNVYGEDWQLARCEGMFLAHRALGASVSRGELVAEIRRLPGGHPTGADVVPLHSERDGIVLGLRSKALIREGNWAILIGKPGSTA
jgi:predicted deacylase